MKKKEYIEEVAKHLFLKHGISDTSIRDITEMSKVAKGSFYIYFKDKSELVYQIAKKEQVEIFKQMLQSTGTHAKENLTSWAEQSFLELVTFFEGNKNQLRFVYHSMLEGHLPKPSHIQNYVDSIPLLESYAQSFAALKHISLAQAVTQLVQIYEMVTFACYSAYFIHQESQQQMKESLQLLIRSLCN